MNKLITNLCLIFLALGAAACVDYKGNFEAEQDLIFVHSTMFGNERTRVVPAGSYNTEFRFQRFSDKVRFSLKGSQEIDIKINIPSNVNIPREGYFYLTAEQTGQRYDLEGELFSDSSRSRVYDRVETCHITVYETRCDTVCNPSRPNGTPVCYPVCRQVPVTRTGYRDVIYYYEDTLSQLELTVLDRNTGEQLGTYNGSDMDSRKVYTYRGSCRGRHFFYY